jgi:hypothetical protein
MHVQKDSAQRGFQNVFHDVKFAVTVSWLIEACTGSVT